MLSAALHKVHRPIVLSLSPGPAPLDKASGAEPLLLKCGASRMTFGMSGLVTKTFRKASEINLPAPRNGPRSLVLDTGPTRTCFRSAAWSPVAGWEKPRTTRLTHDEQRTLLTLWSIFRSPLIMGGNLTLSDEWTAVRAHQCGVNRRRSAFHRQPRRHLDRQGRCLAIHSGIRRRRLRCRFQSRHGRRNRFTIPGRI